MWFAPIGVSDLCVPAMCVFTTHMAHAILMGHVTTAILTYYFIVLVPFWTMTNVDAESRYVETQNSYEPHHNRCHTLIGMHWLERMWWNWCGGNVGADTMTLGLVTRCARVIIKYVSPEVPRSKINIFYFVAAAASTTWFCSACHAWSARHKML